MHSFWRKLEVWVGVGGCQDGPTWESQASFERRGPEGLCVLQHHSLSPQEEALLGQRELRQNQAEQSPAGRQWRVLQPGGNSQAWGRQAGAWLGSLRLQGEAS